MKRATIFKILSHLLFWVLYVLVFSAISKKFFVDTFIPYNVYITTPVQIGLVYFIRNYLFNRYYCKGRTALYIFIATFSILYIIPVVWMIYMIVWKINVTFSRLFTTELLFVYLITFTIVFVSVSVRLIGERKKEQADRDEFEREKMEMELFALKNQIDSHFLFNTLNNIYGLALKKSDLTPRSVLLLSEILSFVIYETKNDFYPLAKEIQLINNYIELEKLRYGDGIRIDFEASDDNNNSCVTPLILFTFIENSFKHGFSKTSDNPWVKIRLKSVVSEIFFEIENSVPEISEIEVGGENKGIGLENIQRRLTLLYPKMHKLVTRMDDKSFYVELTLFNNY